MFLAFKVAILFKIFTLRTALCLLWLGVVGGGFITLMDYQDVAGSTGATPERWPAGTKIVLDAHHKTLLMFAHPQCPCTRASMEELNRVLAHGDGKVVTQVWFFKPSRFSDDWAHTDLWKSIQAIPGVEVHDDVDGTQARLFGAETSGYVLLYDSEGQLLFKGGITGSRGHAGDNEGESAVIAFLNGEGAQVRQTKVFGCSLLDHCEATSPTTNR